MSDLIPFELIRSFAGTDESRLILTEPHLIGEKVVATNGRALVEVDRSEILGFEDVSLLGRYPDYEVIFKGMFGVSSTFRSNLPVLPPGSAADCNVICDDCSGTGQCDCCCPQCGSSESHVCGSCDGEGLWVDASKWKLEYCNSWFSGLWMEKVLRLPNLCFLETEPNKILGFRFGQSGRGAVMPLREPIIVS